MRNRIVIVIALIVTAVPPPAFAQRRAEVGVYAGWTFSDGVETSTSIVAGDGNVYDSIDPKDSWSWGFNVGALVGDNAEFGFMYGNQLSTLVVGGTSDFEIGDLSIKTYHGYFAYNFGAADGAVRPYVFGGFGATNYGSVDFNVLGRVGTIGSETQFSSTWGAGVKFLPSPHFGVKAQLRLTPTYIKTDPGGWWCDPYWGCYLTGDPQYSNQFDISGGVVVRF